MNKSNMDQTSSQSSTNLVDSYMEASSSTTKAQAQAPTQAQAPIQAQAPMQAQAPIQAQASKSNINTSNSQKVSQTIIGVFESRSNAQQAVDSLRQQGFTSEEINIISKKPQGEDVSYDDDITDGTLTGGTLGGIGGLLLGTGFLAIPGMAPVAALVGGPIAAAVGGAIAGGITGGLIDWGIPAEESQHYEEEVTQGSILAIIRTDAAKVNSVAQILRRNGAKEVKTHSK